MNETPPTKRVVREVASHAAITFVFTLAVQATTFGIFALAALVLTTAEFARLSVIIAAVMLASALFELGLNITSTKLYGDNREDGYLRVALVIRLLLVPFGLAIGTTVAFLGLSEIGLGVALGAILNLWNGVRATDQARQAYGSFARSSLAFAILRALGGIFTLISFREASLVAVAVYAVPVVACLASTSGNLLREAARSPLPKLAGMLRYGTYVYINSVTFIAAPYVPQFFIASRLNATDVGAYGLVLTFTAPVALVAYSLRSVLLPKMLGADTLLERLLWSRRGLTVIICFAALMAAGGVIVATGLDILYGQRFELLQSAFLIFFFSYSATSAIGMYTLSVHTRGVPKLACLVGIAKLLVLLCLIFSFGTSLLAIVSIASVVMVAFEIILVLFLARMQSQ